MIVVKVYFYPGMGQEYDSLKGNMTEYVKTTSGEMCLHFMYNPQRLTAKVLRT